MTTKQLIKLHNYYNPDSYFFSKDTLNFFGECISKMYVWKNTKNVCDDSGVEHECYVLSSMQRNYPIKHYKCIAYHYIDVNTYEVINSEKKLFLKYIPFN